jgi:hypothetical protein
MTNVQMYWREVRRVEATLPENPWTISLADPATGGVAGRVMQVSREAAAKAIVEKKARLATKEEFAAYWDAEEDRRLATLAQELRRKGQAVIVLPPKPKPGGGRGSK